MNKFVIINLAALAFVLGGSAYSLHKINVMDTTAVAIDTETISSPTVGSMAPDFETEGALAGNAFKFKLSDKLKEGPLVLYFFPKVFTPGCTAEAHDFAEKTEDFNKLGANIIGMSADDLEGLSKFSKEECRDKFAVARATPEIIAAYGVAIEGRNMANRTSFVINKDGKIAHIYSNRDYSEHVNQTYAAVQGLSAHK